VKNSTLRNGITNQICRVMAGFTDPEIDQHVRARLVISILPAQTFVSSSEMIARGHGRWAGKVTLNLIIFTGENLLKSLS